jgi:hypothetical protein
MKTSDSKADRIEATLAAENYLNSTNLGDKGIAHCVGDPCDIVVEAGADWDAESARWTGWTPLADELNAQGLSALDMSEDLSDGGIYVQIHSNIPVAKCLAVYCKLGQVVSKRSARSPALTVLEALQEAADNIERDIREKFFS